MEDKKMTEKESLELITAMINRTRERYIGDGNILLMWGYLTVIVTALVWIMLIMTHNPAARAASRVTPIRSRHKSGPLSAWHRWLRRCFASGLASRVSTPGG